MNDRDSRLRTLEVDVRVGDYEFDSSRFVVSQGRGGVSPQGEGSAVTTLDDDYDAIRRQIWLATDAAYKRAVSMFARKKAAFQNRATQRPAAGLLAGDAGQNHPPRAAPAGIANRLGAAGPRSVGGLESQSRPPVVSGVGRRAVRHALLPEQ